MGERVVRNDEAGGSIPPRSTCVISVVPYDGDVYGICKRINVHRFYSQHADFSKKNISITDSNEIHHIKDVLRLNKGDKIVVFNGKNQQASAVITDLKEREVIAAIESFAESSPKSTRIILACAVPKKAKFEFIIEKCTELGVDEIIPLKTKRSEVIYSQEKNPAKQDRFQKVAINAAKQCGRADIPKITPMMPLGEALKTLNGGLALFPSLNGHPKHIFEALTLQNPPQSITIFIGPEGDFTPDEVALAEKAGCIPVSLGPTVLKVDTAAISAVALARYFYLK